MSRRWGCRRLGRGDGGLYLEVRHREPNQLPMTVASVAGAGSRVDRHPGSFTAVLVAEAPEYFPTLGSEWADKALNRNSDADARVLEWSDEKAKYSPRQGAYF